VRLIDDPARIIVVPSFWQSTRIWATGSRKPWPNRPIRTANIALANIIDHRYSKNGFASRRILSQICPIPAHRPVGEDCTTMDQHVISPLDRMLILTFGAMASWVAVGGVAVGASKLLQHLL
jgi:hypothetical protein